MITCEQCTVDKDESEFYFRNDRQCYLKICKECKKRNVRKTQDIKVECEKCHAIVTQSEWKKHLLTKRHLEPYIDLPYRPPLVERDIDDFYEIGTHRYL